MNLTEWFARRDRDNGESFVTLADGAPEWLREAVMAAHEGELPNDWRYDTCENIVRSIVNDDERSSEDIAESWCDTYTADVMRWLSSDLTRTEVVDEWTAEYGWSARDGIVSAIRGGQWLTIDRMASILLDAIADNTCSEDDCWESTDDGEGYDGRCGSCADRADGGAS